MSGRHELPSCIALVSISFLQQAGFMALKAFSSSWKQLCGSFNHILAPGSRFMALENRFWLREADLRLWEADSPSRSRLIAFGRSLLVSLK